MNPFMVRDLKALGLWDKVMVNDIKYYDGSLQAIERIPQDLKQKYATAFEVEPRWLVDAASRRQKWIDQAQSLNLYCRRFWKEARHHLPHGVVKWFKDDLLLTSVERHQYREVYAGKRHPECGFFGHRCRPSSTNRRARTCRAGGDSRAGYPSTSTAGGGDGH